MYRRDPEKCVPGDTVEKQLVIDWPKMTNKSAVEFRRFTGLKLEGVLVRKGNRIFEYTEADLALCRYNHYRQF